MSFFASDELSCCTFRSGVVLTPMVDDSQKQILALIADMQREAYQKGWNDAVKKILAAAQQGTPLSSQPAPKGPEPVAEKPSSPQYDTPIIQMVYQIVQEKPGLKGHQVVKAIISRDPTISLKVADRTGRTSLSRLRKRNKIIQQNRKWYPAEDEYKEKEPAVGSLALSEPGWRN